MGRVRIVQAVKNRLLFSLKGKLILSFLAISILPLSTVFAVTFLQFQEALRTQTSNQLTAMRDLKAKQVETHLREIEQDIGMIAGFPYVRTAAQQLEIAVRAQGLNQIRQMGFLGRPDLLYTVAYSAYSVFHGKYHTFFRDLIHNKGYSDIWLVAPNGSVVYTYAKRGDFAVNLFDAPHRHTPPAHLFQNILASGDSGRIQRTDYVFYAPAGEVPVSFVGAPILDDDGMIIGCLIYELPSSQLNDLLQTHTDLWETGETYLVGRDNVLRTRTQHGDQQRFYAQKVFTTPVQKGLSDESGILITENYRNVPVLSAYRPIEFSGFTWILLAEVETSEAFGPANRLRNLMIVVMVISALAVMVVGFYIGRGIAEPIVELAETSTRIASGDLRLKAKSNARDEIGHLAEAFNSMTSQISSVIASLEQQVAERRQAEKALSESEDRYRGLFENSPVSLWEEDFSQGKEYLDRLRESGVTDWRSYLENNPEVVAHCAQLVQITDVNQATLDMFGAKDKDDLFAGLPRVFTEDSVAVFREELITLAEGGRRFESEAVQRTLAGEDIHVALQMMVAPGYEDSLGKVLVSLLDITERKLAHEKLEKHREYLEEVATMRNAELTVAKEQAEAANAAKSDFLARMSHEIRTPLNAIVGLTHIVLKSELTADQRDYLSKVLIASDNLLDVVNDILDFSRVEAGRLEIGRSAFDLGELFERLADLFSNRIESKDLELVLVMDPGVPRQLMGDAARLLQVLTNLVENAVKFTSEGEVVVAVEPADQGELLDGQVDLEFRVSDTGIGIGADLIPTLFEPFSQAGSYLTREHQGSGLGLAICQRLVKMMGGTIQVQSELGRGSTFVFTTRLSTSEGEAATVPPEDLHGLRVLVADDNEPARRALVNSLTSFASKVTAVGSGKEAVEVLRRTDEKVAAVGSGKEAVEVLRQTDESEPFDLVLLDWKMPDMDCIETTTQIHKETNCHARIVLLVTAFGRELIRDTINSAAIDGSLLKPVKPSQLFDTVTEFFGAPDRAVPPRAPVRPAHATPQLGGRRVLLVEDSEINRDVAVALLEETGVTVELAENGEVAVQRVVAAPIGYFDAVLMDIQMPVMDGYQATRRIRGFEQRQSSASDDTDTRTPIIALTAHALKGEEERCLAADMDDYLTKPLDEYALHQTLAKWIRA